MDIHRWKMIAPRKTTKMNINIENIAQLFKETYYEPSYKDWRLNKSKAGKDVIGEHYEAFRNALYTNAGYQVARKRIATYNPDLLIYKNNQLVLIEEAKGHYVDSCFLKRAIGNYAECILHYMDRNETPPRFCLSCPTSMKNYESIRDKYVRIYEKSIQDCIKENFSYISLCEHGRINKEQYFTKEESCFKLSDKLIEKQIRYINGL